MEVDRDNFYWMLPHILDEMQNAQFVAIDIEMSGIASGYCHKTPIPDAYTKIKEASERYQILQIGFTFIRYLEKPNGYTTRTISCYVSPLFPSGYFTESLSRHLDRQFSISARSYSFLRRHGFNFSKAVDNGVYYLNRKEQKIAEEFCSFKGPKHEHIDPLSLDQESQQWYSDTSKQIGEYVNKCAQVSTKERYEPSLETIIQNPYGRDINGLQTRLIHQIIHEEYPTCNAKRIPSGHMAGSFSVTVMTRAFTTQTKNRILANVNETKRLSGLQILFEALSGGSFAEKVDQQWVCHSDRASVGNDTWNEFNRKFNFHQCEANLKKNRPIIIGHNAFQDLAFIYQTFFEPLPPKVDDFLTSIHQLFPCIIDTKFMHTRRKHMMDQDRSLKYLDDYFANHKFPPIRHLSNLGDITTGPHDAAYDSVMTANVFLRGACYMASTKKHLDEVEEACYAPPKSQGASGDRDDAPSSHPTTAPRGWDPANPFTILDEEEAEVVGALKDYEVLSPDDTFSLEAAPLASPTIPSPPTTTNELEWRKVETATRSRQPVPEWTDDFWRVYGNKTLIPGAGVVSFV
ncbi:CAF1-domain-containing protein [Hypoxylon sp. FL1150]|nr:CAF1-domain-containing protein [Hypoxylon sp. FL1150]